MKRIRAFRWDPERSLKSSWQQYMAKGRLSQKTAQAPPGLCPGKEPGMEKTDMTVADAGGMPATGVFHQRKGGRSQAGVQGW